MHAMKSQDKIDLFNSLLETRSRFLREYPLVSPVTVDKLVELHERLREAARIHSFDAFTRNYLDSVNNILRWYKYVGEKMPAA